MRKFVSVAGLPVLLLLAVSSGFAGSPQAAKGGAKIVIVFKDGHQQSFNLADISRVEFPGASAADVPTASSTMLPPRGHFIGKWEVGDGNGGNFFITLNEGGDAKRTLGDVRGRWVYVNGEAQITWDDGAMDAIRKVGSSYQKFAYHEGKTFTDVPDNVTNARNTATKPI